MTKKILKKPHRKLCKELQQPIAIEPMPSLPSAGARAMYPELNEQYDKELAAWSKQTASHQLTQTLHKLGLLLDHYNLPRGNSDNWCLLAIYLAQQYVPGFQTEIKAKSGRPRLWDSTLLLKLYLAVEQKLIEAKTNRRSITIENICLHLMKEEPWKSIPGCNDGILQDRYSQARKEPTVILLENIGKVHPNIDIKKEFRQTLEKNEKMFPRNSRKGFSR